MFRRHPLAMVIPAFIGAFVALGAWSWAASWKSVVESDWLSPASIGRFTGPQPVSPEGDAAGGCDGIINGRYGFHTNEESSPWWQVDLEQITGLSRIVIYNRCDAPDRASRLIVLLSTDGANWTETYRHDGTSFFGFTDGKPLVIKLNDAKARYVRIQLPYIAYLHLDEVQVYGAADPGKNIALHKPTGQSSVSQWSVSRSPSLDYPIAEVLTRGRKLAQDLRGKGVKVDEAVRRLDEVERSAKSDQESSESLYIRAREAIRKLVFSNPLINFDKLVFVKRAPGTYSHMSDQNYGWWSRPGGGLYILEGLKGDEPQLKCLTGSLPAGSVNCPDLSHDGRRILFAYCRYYPEVARMRKLDKSKLPEEAFYHVYEVNTDGTGLRRLTKGRYDDMFPKYLPSGEILFLSTRRGQYVQCDQANTMSTLTADMPDSYVRCGGDAWRPVAIYTMHTMSPDRATIRPVSAFESFEWTPMVDTDGKITYTRWDYVDRNNMPYMKLWSTRPDGGNPRILWGNQTTNPMSIFDARRIPGTGNYIAIASAHHSITGGSLIIIDPDKSLEGLSGITRLSPEVCFPETEGWPSTYFTNPYPLSRDYYLVSWSNADLAHENTSNPVNALGLYVYDSFGNLELIYRDPDISSMFPIPLVPSKPQANIAHGGDWSGPQQGTFLLADVYRGLDNIVRGTIKSLRIVAMPAKTQPWMNSPQLGVTSDDPGKCVLGTVPVQKDGSAHFKAPSGVAVFFQALDSEGKAVQTMRSLTYLQPGENLSCVGCHESRSTTPPNRRPMPIAFTRPPANLKPGPEGSWPLRYDRLVQPILDRQCVSCHSPQGTSEQARSIDLTPAKSWETLVNFGKPSVREVVRAAYTRGSSLPGDGPSFTTQLLPMLTKGHYDAKLDADAIDRLTLWMDLYGQKQGSFSEEQEKSLERLKTQWVGILAR